MGEGGLNLIEMWGTMTWVAKGVAFILVIMSMWSFGVAIERIYTFTQARNQSKAYAPQVAKHLKDGRLKDAIALSASKNFRYSHLAKVVLAGLQEFQFQQESGGSLSREDLVDSVRRSIQRATALTQSDLKKGVKALATIGSTAPFVGLLGTVVGVINAFQRHRGHRVGRHRRRVGRYRGSARRDRARPHRRHPGGVVLQLPDRPPRVLQRRDGQLLVGAGRLLHQEDRVAGSRRRGRPHGRPGAPGTESGDTSMAMDLGGARAASSPTSTSRRSSTSCWCCSSS